MEAVLVVTHLLSPHLLRQYLQAFTTMQAALSSDPQVLSRVCSAGSVPCPVAEHSSTTASCANAHICIFMAPPRRARPIILTRPSGTSSCQPTWISNSLKWLQLGLCILRAMPTLLCDYKSSTGRRLQYRNSYEPEIWRECRVVLHPSSILSFL